MTPTKESVSKAAPSVSSSSAAEMVAAVREAEDAIRLQEKRARAKREGRVGPDGAGLRRVTTRVGFSHQAIHDPLCGCEELALPRMLPVGAYIEVGEFCREPNPHAFRIATQEEVAGGAISLQDGARVGRLLEAAEMAALLPDRIEREIAKDEDAIRQAQERIDAKKASLEFARRERQAAEKSVDRYLAGIGHDRAWAERALAELKAAEAGTLPAGPASTPSSAGGLSPSVLRALDAEDEN